MAITFSHVKTNMSTLSIWWKPEEKYPLPPYDTKPLLLTYKSHDEDTPSSIDSNESDEDIEDIKNIRDSGYHNNATAIIIDINDIRIINHIKKKYNHIRIINPDERLTFITKDVLGYCGEWTADHVNLKQQLSEIITNKMIVKTQLSKHTISNILVVAEIDDCYPIIIGAGYKNIVTLRLNKLKFEWPHEAYQVIDRLMTHKNNLN